MNELHLSFLDIPANTEQTKQLAMLYRVAHMELQMAEIKGKLYQMLYERSRLNELKDMPYKDYLATPEWRGVRSGALGRANHKCELCNASGVELHVHHKTYERRGEELPEDLIVLCKDCHAKHHDKEAK